MYLGVDHPLQSKEKQRRKKREKRRKKRKQKKERRGLLTLAHTPFTLLACCLLVVSAGL
jgi:hypothetical protein